MSNISVSSINDTNTKDCNIDSIKAQLHPIIAIEILKIVLSPSQHPDKWIWTEERDKNFNIRSTYKLIENSQRISIGVCSIVNAQVSL